MNRDRSRGPRRPGRRGAAALEMVLVLPFLCFLGLASTDYARLFYTYATLADCARNGALYASDASFATSTTFTSVSQAALADASNISPTPTVSSTSGTDSNGVAYVKVTVSYTFTTLAPYPGIPSSVPIAWAVQMALTPGS